MRVQVGQVPTPQGISALLRKAGFSRSEASGRFWRSSGYRVGKSYTDSTTVHVEYVTSSGGPPPGQREAWLGKYAAAIRAAGWTVTGPEPDAWPRLTVMPRPVPGTSDTESGN